MTISLSILLYFYLAYLVIFIIFSFFNFFHLIAYSSPNAKIYALLLLYVFVAAIIISITFFFLSDIDWTQSLSIGFQPPL